MISELYQLLQKKEAVSKVVLSSRICSAISISWY